ncbi:cupredoxin domain-containing protein [Streptomyces sp. V4I23]|uniref:cupredoxin domain-containing protein n=1 Tax=Streptomyces sp. V4I23 TaxID=3042282 RepID=UPI0027D8C4CC|nr:cupredoxin domain-containing protein [Streptomyces sp. V4I23]
MAAATAFTMTALAVGLSAPAASAATHSVSIRNLQYNPATISVDVGDAVTWSNDDSVFHSVTGGPLNSPDMEPGQKYSFTFSSAGTFNYRCKFHPDMTGSVVVGGSSSPSPTPSPTGSATPSPTPTSTATTPPPDGGSSGGGGGEGEGGAPVGTGPLPVSMRLTDNQGSWYDTNVNLFGGRSLAVAELPRVPLSKTASSLPGVNLDGLPLVGEALGDGALLGDDALGALNGDLSGLDKFDFDGSDAPLVGELGVDPLKLLGLDSTKEAISTVLPEGDPRAEKAATLLDQLAEQMRSRPANSSTTLADLPVGADLLPLLEDIQKYAETNDLELPVTANFDISAPQAASAHTVTGLIWPDGAKGFPFDQPGAFVGKTSVQLTEPGLYAFACKIHPYMLGAIVVDDPLTPGLDFGKKLRVNSRSLNVPSDGDIIAQLVQKFFNITVPGNWQKYSNTEDRQWNPAYPPAPILMHDSEGRQEIVPSLDAYLKNKFHTPKTLPATSQRPGVPGVGEVWVDTQMEKTAGKTKSGAATKIDVSTWTVDRKVALPEINMNNPHNMWTDREEKYIYQTEWFDNKLDVFDRKTGEFVRQIEVGTDPSHVMTRTDTDQLHVALNGGSAVMELSPGATKIDRRIPVQAPGEKVAHPHAHWMSADGKTMVTPNVNSYDSTVVDIPTGGIRKEATGELPIATGMTPDSSKVYEANFLGASVSCISLKDSACNDGGAKTHSKQIDLWRNYDPVKGSTGPFGGLPIQIPVSPDGKAVLVANTLTSNITVIDPKTDEVKKWLPCDAGCHGINFGAKKGGGYYAYVVSKFSNAMSIVDIDPDNNGDISDAKVVGRMVIAADENTKTDDRIVDYAGMGGQGVLAIPLAYNGWVQNVPSNAVNDQLTCRQRNPLDYESKCS